MSNTAEPLEGAAPVNPADMTLDEIRLYLAPHVAEAAIFDGWSETALREASQAAGVDPDVAALAFNGSAMAMIGAWIDSIDAAMPRATASMRSGRSGWPGDVSCSPNRGSV